MLTAALRVYHWDRRTSSISSDRLEADTLPILEHGLAVYRRHLGQTRGRVRNAARRALEGLRPDRVEPVVKLLDDTATYAWPPTAGRAAQRVRVFEAAGRRHPLLEAAAAREVLADTLGPKVAPADACDPAGGPGDGRGDDARVAFLYADYPEFHRLVAFPAGYGAEALRADYDLAQAQALLYAATAVTVEARRDFKHILRYARLARLLHRVERLRRRGEDGYRFVLDGPNSVLRRTRAYGVDFARFLAALVRLSDWRLTAEIELRKGWRPLTCTFTAKDGLGAIQAGPPEFDSSLEEALATKFGRKRDGWRLRHEAAVLDIGGSLLVPDFVFRHQDGTEVVLEIAGYWTPEYIAEKLHRLHRVRGVNLIVAVPRPLALRAAALPATVLPFKRRILLEDLMPRLEAFRTGTRPRRRGRC